MFQKHTIFILVLCLCLIGIVSSQNLIGASPPQPRIYDTIFINQSPNQFFFYNIYDVNNGDIIINITDQSLKNYKYTIDKTNDLNFRAAYYKFIILQQRNSTDTLFYWLIEINGPLDYLQVPINPNIDNEDYLLGNNYLLTSIIQYNQFDNFLYVVLEGYYDIRIYGINLDQNDSGILILINWFNQNRNQPEVIAGGNSRVLVQATYDRFWVDIRPVRANNSKDFVVYNNTYPTIYIKYFITDLTPLPIYPGGSIVFKFMNSYFEYASFSSDLLNMTAFLYHGYGNQTIQYEVSIISQQKIITFSDRYNFFLAIGDQDIYLTVIQWNQTEANYSTFSNTLKNTKLDQNTFTDTIKVFNDAQLVVYNDHKLYFLTKSVFYVYGGDTYFTQLYQNAFSESIATIPLAIDRLFSEIQLYLNKK